MLDEAQQTLATLAMAGTLVAGGAGDALAQATGNPCAAKTPGAAKNPCAAKNPRAAGAVLVKESFEARDGKPGRKARSS